MTTTQEVPITATAPGDMSMTDIRKVLGGTAPPKEARVSSETETVQTVDDNQAATETADKDKQQQVEEFPENVRKKIARETARAAEAQKKIDAAIGERKAKEAELQKLTGKSGSEPAKKENTEPAKDEMPVMPDSDTFKGTWDEYQAALKAYPKQLQEYLAKQTRETVTQELTAKQREAEFQKEWTEAAKKHGAEFGPSMKRLADATSPEFQVALSELDGCYDLGMHLAKPESSEELDTITELFEKSPAKAIAALGKLEAKLSAAANPETKQDKEPLPKPLKPLGGGAVAGGGVDAKKLEQSGISTLRKFLGE